MAGDRTTLESMRQVFTLIVGVLGLVLTVLGLFIDDVSAIFVGVVFVVAAVMGEGLSHFAVGRGRLIMKSRAKPDGTAPPVEIGGPGVSAWRGRVMPCAPGALAACGVGM